jgi:hypothetical protein
MLAKEPGMGLAAGHATTLTSSAFRRLPIGSGFAATTACAWATSTALAGIRCTATYTA